MEELRISYPEALFYLRGDFNVNDKNKNRTSILNIISEELELCSLSISHPTYHHFMGGGASDSHLDKIFFPKDAKFIETLINITCKLTNPLIESHHDLIMSQWKLPFTQPLHEATTNIKAPRIPNDRTSITWSDLGITQYEALVTPQLHRLQDLWLKSPTRTSMSLLLQSTNHILKTAAALTNNAIDLSKPFIPRSCQLSKEVKTSQKNLIRDNRQLRNSSNVASADKLSNLKNKHSKAKTEHRKLVRKLDVQESIKRNEQHHTIISNPSKIFQSIRNAKRCSSGKVEKLNVGNKVYLGDQVADGFFDSLSNLKSIDRQFLDNSTSYNLFKEDYQHILKICSAGKPLPPVSEMRSLEILTKIKANTKDFFSITSKHYLNAGQSGIEHFYLVLNALIKDLENFTITDINIVHAQVLFKGHQKDKNSERSYRTISICPIIAKAMDLYVRGLNLDAWNADQSEVQFQGEGSSHELAALLLTETIQHSLYVLHEPIFLLYLDAMSAYDVVLKEFLVKNLYHCGTDNQSLLFINNRLDNRTTCLEWDKQLVGPIKDERGLEQGGTNSTDFYKVFGKEQVQSAQTSKLGVPLKNAVISALAQADDTILSSISPNALQNLLQLTLNFCSKHHVQLCVEKTKLQVMSTKSMKFEVEYLKTVSPINIDGVKLEFVDNAEHVGIIRSIDGNIPNILNRMSAHTKALAAILHTGASRHHRGNPAANIKLDQVYGIPVLLSGLGALVLKKSEVETIDSHIRKTINNLMRLLPGTPRCVTYFLSGSLPGSALLHLRQFSLFGMICRLPSSILHNLATDVLTVPKRSPKSWFIQIRTLCLMYGLPHPLNFLQNAVTKTNFKKQIKKHVIDYWEKILRQEASILPSLQFFHPEFMSLTSPHSILTTAGSSPYRVNMSTVQCHMISGRFRTEALCSHWSLSNSKECTAPSCQGFDITEDLSHILAYCSSLTPTRQRLAKFTHEFCSKLANPEIRDLIITYSEPSHPSFCQFLVDCSSIPEVISSSQVHGQDVLLHSLHVSRVWCYCINRDRLRRLGRWMKSK